MRRQGWIGRPGAPPSWRAGRSRAATALLAVGLAGAGWARGQEPPRPDPTPGRAIVEPAPAVVEGAPAIVVVPPNVQVVRFRAPEGVKIEVLGPAPEPVPAGDGRGQATVGLKVGVGYRLRISEIPDRPGLELFPTVEAVGHLHRPASIDPGKFPIRINFELDDLDDAARGRLVTQVVYLEDPELALPVDSTKDEIPFIAVNPTEDPLKVAAALGRVMAVVQVGGRKPTADELNGGTIVDFPGSITCPFTGPGGSKCAIPCGPVCGTPPPPGRPWIPRDEFLCDGGDQAEPLHFGGDGGLRGVDPRDALIRFRPATFDQIRPQIDELRQAYERGELTFEAYSVKADRIARSTQGLEARPRVLPTNVVCIYAPRFAAVRVSIGPDENIVVEGVRRAEKVERQEVSLAKQGPKRLMQNQAAIIGRHRSRASGFGGRVFASENSEVRILSGFDVETLLAGAVLVQGAESNKVRSKAALEKFSSKASTINNPVSAVITGIIEGAGQTVMSWRPTETVGVEVPPNKPGLAVIKRVDVEEAEAGDAVNFVIQYRNMGNTPIASVSVIDSLLPRLKYVPGSAQGPAGAVFTAQENRVGSTELRWDLPGVIAPGAEGSVVFKAIVR